MLGPSSSKTKADDDNTVRVLYVFVCGVARRTRKQETVTRHRVNKNETTDDEIRFPELSLAAFKAWGGGVLSGLGFRPYPIRWNGLIVR